MPTMSGGTCPRGMHCCASIAARRSALGLTVRSTSVATPPGRMAFTVIPWGPNSRRQRVRHADYGSLRGDVMQVVLDAKRYGVGGDVDDAPPLRRTHRRCDRTYTEERSRHVDPHDEFPFVQRDLVEWPLVERRKNRCVVHEHVERPYRATTAAAIASTEALSPMLTITSMARPPAASISFFTDAAFAALRSATTAIAPARRTGGRTRVRCPGRHR